MLPSSFSWVHLQCRCAVEHDVYVSNGFKSPLFVTECTDTNAVWCPACYWFLRSHKSAQSTCAEKLKCASDGAQNDLLLDQRFSRHIWPKLLSARCGVQVCTGVMLHGYPLVQNLCGGLQAFMESHKFESIDEFRGASLPYFTTHHDLYTRQQEVIKAKKSKRVGLESDAAWTGDGFVQETESMVSN